jgi:hypothetical protein
MCLRLGTQYRFEIGKGEGRELENDAMDASLHIDLAEELVTSPDRCGHALHFGDPAGIVVLMEHYNTIDFRCRYQFNATGAQRRNVCYAWPIRRRRFGGPSRAHLCTV